MFPLEMKITVMAETPGPIPLPVITATVRLQDAPYDDKWAAYYAETEESQKARGGLQMYEVWIPHPHMAGDHRDQLTLDSVPGFPGHWLTVQEHSDFTIEYRGHRGNIGGPRETEVTVTRNGVTKELNPHFSLELRNHSPAGFSWGYSGSGPAQLALAILLDFTGDGPLSLKLYQQFKGQCIATIDQEADFVITGTTIAAFLHQHEAQR